MKNKYFYISFLFVLLSNVSFSQKNQLVLDSLYQYQNFQISFIKTNSIKKSLHSDAGFNGISYKFFDEKDKAMLMVCSYFYFGEMRKSLENAKKKVFKDQFRIDSSAEEKAGKMYLENLGLFEKILSQSRIQIGEPKINAIKFNCLAKIDGLDCIVMIAISIKEKDPQTQIMYLVPLKSDMTNDEQNFKNILETFRFIE